VTRHTRSPFAVLLLVGASAFGLFSESGTAAGKKSDSEVKTTAKAGKIGEDGTQVVTVTLTINKGWHIYANPVDNKDQEDAQTVVTISGKTKPEDVKVEYPAGKLIKDKLVGDYRIYEDKVEIKATVKRAKGDTGPLEATVKFQACNDKTCLQGAKVTVPVE
jgi:DsbC/DsbD-like thiol-disulfide interchange protein